MGEAKDVFAFLEELREKHQSDRQNYDDFNKYLDRKARESNIPLSGQFELTPLCNFDCKMCYVHLSKEQLHFRPLLTVDQWKDIIRQAFDAGMMNATLTGGECLAYPGFREIYLYLHSLGCQVYVMSNGFLLGEEWIRFFLAHPPAGISITLYGSNEDVYERVTGCRAFETVVSHLRMIRAAGLPLRIGLTPSRYLGEDVFETLRLAKTLAQDVDVNSTMLTPREETGRASFGHDADIDLYVRLFRRIEEENGNVIKEIPADQLPPAGGPHHTCEKCGLLCGGGRSCFDVTWEGVLTACNEMDTMRSYPLRDGFAAAWHEINRMANSWPQVPECRDCPYESICTVCAAKVWQQCGQAGKRPAALCERTRYFVQHGVIQLPQCE